MVPAEKEYEFVCGQVRYHLDRIWNGFGDFMKLFPAIVAGTVWLNLQEKVSPEDANSVAWLSVALVWLLTMLTCLKAYENYHAWRGYRERQIALRRTGQPKGARGPRRWRSALETICTAIAVVGAASMYNFFVYRVYGALDVSAG